MSTPTILPSGRLHPDLLKGPFVKQLGGSNSAAASSERGEKLQADWKQAEERINRIWRENRDSVIDLSGHFAARSVDTYDGKTVVENKAPGLIVETYDPTVYTAEDANKSAASGGATHGFFYRNTDFLFNAAQEYTALGENEVFRYRNIDDVNFVRDALDFFTDGNYTQGDVNSMQEQMTKVVRELAQQLKNGEAPDLGKVKTTFAIGGAEVTVSRLLELQKTGRELSERFNGTTSGSLSAQNIEAFAEMGAAKALGNYYGSQNGAIGRLFSQGIDRLYAKGTAAIKKANAWAQTVSYGAGTASNRDAVKTELGIAELFSKMDISSKSSLIQSFSSTLTQARSLVQQYCNQYRMPTSHVGLAGATVGIESFFHSWMEKL